MIQVSPGSSKGPQKGKARTQSRGEGGRMRKEADISAMWPQAKEDRQRPALEGARNGFSLPTS